MIFLTKFRSNDLSESKGKQIEFSKSVCEDFFEFKNPNEQIVFYCKSLSDPTVEQIIHANFRLSVQRGDYKIYQNDDGTPWLKDFFLNTLGLTQKNNGDDFYFICKKAPRTYLLYYVPNNELFTGFITAVKSQPILVGNSIKDPNINAPRQVIYYGAPGTGKSHEVKLLTQGYSVIRITFHPDTDYATFVGAYKPVMEEAEVRVVPVVLNDGTRFDQNNGTYKERRISYKFVKQAFLKAYLMAWKKYAEADGEVEPQFLVIEEINRGNCAQIFGDLFQLLDRSDSGFSTYPIEADTDLQTEIEKAFKGEDGSAEYELANNIEIDSTLIKNIGRDSIDLAKDIQEGRSLLLPPNLYIWATMNTSDQSLFPIDSAFKRRWDWKYVKIAEGYQKDDEGKFLKDEQGKRIPLGWKIHVKDSKVDWWKFIQAINPKIADAASGDDKKLGYFFCKPEPQTNVIKEDTFVGKVMFYLWNDVFKDNDNSIFNVDSTKNEPSFDTFYVEDEETGFTKPNSDAILKFLENVVGSAQITKIHEGPASDNQIDSEAEEKEINLEQE